MSEVVKPKKKNPVIKTLQWIGVVAVSLILVAFFVFSDSFGGRTDGTLVGKVNGQPIYYARDSEFAANYERIMQSMQTFNNLGGVFEGFAEYQAFLQTVNNMLLHKNAKKHILVSDESIVNNIKGFFFTDGGGTFNQASYEAFLKNQSASENIKLERDVRKNIEIEMFRYELFQIPKSSSFNVAIEYIKENTKRTVEMVYANASSTVRNKIPTDTELQSFFKSNTTNFVQADVAWIVFKSGTTANNIYNALKSDKSIFAEKAKEVSEDETTKALGGDVGYLTAGELPSKAIADAVFKVKKNDTLIEPIFFDDKYYIILVKNIRVPDSMAQVSKDSVIAKYNEIEGPKLIETEKAKLKAAILADYKASEPKDKYKTSEEAFAAMSKNLKAKWEGYETYFSGDFSYGSSAIDKTSGTTLPGSYEDIFSKIAFSTPIGGTSEVIDLPNGVGVIKVLGENKKSLENFASLTAEEKDSFFTELQNTKAQRLGNGWAQIAYSKARIQYKLGKK